MCLVEQELLLFLAPFVCSVLAMFGGGEVAAAVQEQPASVQGFQKACWWRGGDEVPHEAGCAG